MLCENSAHTNSCEQIAHLHVVCAHGGMLLHPVYRVCRMYHTYAPHVVCVEFCAHILCRQNYCITTSHVCGVCIYSLHPCIQGIQAMWEVLHIYITCCECAEICAHSSCCESVHTSAHVHCVVVWSTYPVYRVVRTYTHHMHVMLLCRILCTHFVSTELLQHITHPRTPAA